MTVAALVISIFALGTSAWAAVSYQRQANANVRSAAAAERTDEAAQRSADAAERSAKAAEAAARDASEVARREVERHHSERQPDLTLDLTITKAALSDQPVRLHSDGPVSYERTEIWADMNDAQTRRSVIGVSTARASVAREAREERVVVPQLAVGQDVDFVIFRSNIEMPGRARFIVTCQRGDETWQTIAYVDLPRQKRVILA